MGAYKQVGSVKKIFGAYGRSIKAIENAEPNSRTDFYDEKTGKLLQQRWYDANGRAVLDRDWDHNNSHNNHKFPHDHHWVWNPNSKKAIRLDDAGYIDENFK